LADIVVNKYAPLPGASLNGLISRLRGGAPQWRKELKAAARRARDRLAHASVDGVDWYWPAAENPRTAKLPQDASVRLLAPFDPIVWDRRRFELFWGWRYRFEAYVPAAKRKLGYYALPILWRDEIPGWCNVAVAAGGLVAEAGFVAGGPPPEPEFARGFEAELARMREFLEL
jgi:uncharacterized protein YcaQ